MKRLLVFAPGLAAPVAVDLRPGVAALVGRHPDPRRLAAPFEAEEVRCVAVASEQVSLHHALVWCTPDGVHALDLASRNGTWAELVPDAAATLDVDELRLHLAPSAGAPAAVDDAPPPADWSEREGFSGAVRNALAAWFARLGVDVGVVTDAPAGAARLALASGDGLAIVPGPGATVDARLPALLERAAAFVEDQNALFDQELGHPEDFVLRAPLFRAAHRKVWDAAARGRRLMLLGASGTGKDRLAECYHRHSPRADGPFKAVNCALVEKEMIWVQLFGAARGSFTGAVRDVDGAVAAAHGGTLFLDEVGELSPRMQAALLRFLDRRGEYERLGDPRTRRADVHLVCATNADLRGAVARGEFRADLWFRFAGSVVEVPPLRERPEDVLAALDRARLAPSVNARQALTPAALDAVLRHPWPGNFRELENFVARLPLGARARSVALESALDALAEGSPELRPVPAPAAAPASWERVLAEASASYRTQRDGAGPRTFGDVKDFIDGHLKPAFVAAACGVASGDVPVEGVNFSAAARSLDVGDGTTVKRWLERYFANRAGG
ncbi:MAG: sigma 54-interacting transcriptional regulator [Polyangiales bacterium]